MSAHFPGRRDQHHGARGCLPPMRIEGGRIVINEDTVLNANWIERHGVTIEPIPDVDANRVTVTFLASTVDVTAAALPQIRVHPAGATPEQAGCACTCHTPPPNTKDGQ